MKGFVNNLWFSFTFATVPLLASIVFTTAFTNEFSELTIIGFNWIINFVIYFLVFRRAFPNG